MPTSGAQGVILERVISDMDASRHCLTGQTSATLESVGDLQKCKFFHTLTAQKGTYVSATAIIIENHNNGLRNRKLDFTRYAHVLLSLTLRQRPCLQFQLFSQMFSVVGVVYTSASLGGAEFRPLVCQKTLDKNSAISKWLVLFFGLLLLYLDEVGTAFANEIMSTILADDRCRKLADYIVDQYIDSGCDFAPDLWASSPQRSPTTTSATESLHTYARRA